MDMNAPGQGTGPGMNPFAAPNAPQDAGTQGPTEGGSPPAAPADDSHLVTVPSAAPQSEQDRLLEIKHRGETHKLTEAEVIELAQKGFDYTQKMQELAPAKEMRDFIESTPGAADAIITLMQQGISQQQAQQMVYEQAPQAPQGYPQAPDPGVNFLVSQLADVQAKMEAQEFRGRHPEADFEKVVHHLMQHPEIPNLELAYRDISYEDNARQIAQAQQQQTIQRQQTEVGPGAQGPPESYQVDPRKLTPEQTSAVRDRYNLIE